MRNQFVHWWQGILARSLFVMFGIALLIGSISGLAVSHFVEQHEHQKAVQELNELLSAIERTASIAAFTSDEQLASEVAQGLMRNSNVLRVVIHSGKERLAHIERKVLTADSSSQAPEQVTRSLPSPFKEGDLIGEIVLTIDWDAIAARAEHVAWDTVLLLAGQMALILLAVAVTLLYWVLRPIKAISDRLHDLDPNSSNRLVVPEGHEHSEIGRLVNDVNKLTGDLVATLDQERNLRLQQAIAQRKYQNLFNHATSGIFVANAQGWLGSFNRAFAELTWMYQPDRDTGRNLAEINWHDAEQLLALLHACIADAAHDSGQHAGDYLLIGRRGDERWLNVALIPLGDGSAQGTVSDITQRKREELSARRLAITDPLTGFANRTGLQHVLANLQPESTPLALVMLDLDGLKQINDAMGLPVGDQLILKVAARMQSILRDGDYAARIGGGKFALLLSGEEEREMLSERMEALSALLSAPCVLDGRDEPIEVVIGASIGIAFFPSDGADPPHLLRSAELALNRVHTEGGCAYRFFDPVFQADVEYQRRLEDSLRQALPARQLFLVFQPIVDIGAGRLAGAEALLRWSHPERGMVPPDQFIPLAEKIGLIGDIGRMVLDEACRQVALWRQAGLDMYVSVNVSARQIPDDLPVAVVEETLARHRLPPDAIALEITEGILMSNIAVAQQWIGDLRTAGLRLYLDDFGTGYSSLSYLKRFPMDTVKIDRSFIRDMAVDPGDQALVEAIINMAGSLGLKVVAEGVEDGAQLHLLQEIGCSHVQGYFFSRPLPAKDFFAVAQRINAGMIVSSGG